MRSHGLRVAGIEEEEDTVAVIVALIQVLEALCVLLVTLNIINVHLIQFADFNITTTRAIWSYIVMFVCGEVKGALLLPSAILLFVEKDKDENGRDVPSTITSTWAAVRMYGIFAVALHVFLKKFLPHEYAQLCERPPLHGMIFTSVVAALANAFHFIMLL